MKSNSLLNVSEVSQAHIETLLSLQAIQLSPADLANTHQQFKLIATHAKLVMEFDLDEMVEPAPEFQP